MADLLIRDIDPGLKRQLEEQAKAHGRSLSDEAKVLIRRGLVAPPAPVGLGTRLFSLLPDDVRGNDLVFEVPQFW
jgi:plasmid stability protein